jgi:hypothetical protein
MPHKGRGLVNELMSGRNYGEKGSQIVPSASHRPGADCRVETAQLSQLVSIERHVGT